MTLNTILDRLGLPSNARRSAFGQRVKLRQQKRKHNRRRAILENLEDRRVLATYMVTSLADSGVGSLRAALQSANATGDTDAIVFDGALAGTINLGVANGTLPVSSPVSIQGPGASILTIDANATPSDKFRVFDIFDTANNVSISGLTLTGGWVDDGGGGILFRSADTLTLVDTVVTGNQAANGGGIYSEYEGSVVLQSSTVSGNTAESAKGGGIHTVDGDVSLTDSTISGNHSYSDGAGIFSQYAGNINVTDSQITNNKVQEAGYHGGGIYAANGDVTITGSTISGNESKGDGGGIYSYKGSVAISNTTITGNKADYGGGGVFNYEGDLTITTSVITSNSADYGSGGGVGNTSGRLTISGTRITGNQAVGDGGGVATNNGIVDIFQSLIADNSSSFDGGGISSAIGAVIVNNSTISGNSATGRGGGIQTDAAAVRLVHVTLAMNTAGISGGGIGVNDDSTAESMLIYNSIITLNTGPIGPDLHVPGDPGTVLDIQSSLISDNTDSTLVASSGDANGNVIGSTASPIDAKISPLANNGGATNTHDLDYTSPATDAANLALSLNFGADGNIGGGDDTALTADQRAGLYSRSVIGLSAGPDMGALEKQARPSLVVDTTADIINGDLSPGDRSLREMLALANGDLGDDQISFSLSLPAIITLEPSLGSLLVEENLSFAGPGADLLTIENASGQAFRIFDVLATTNEVSFEGLTLRGGDAGTENGGAIRSDAAQMHLFKVELVDNSAASGGGVAVTSGSLSLVSSTLAGNTASVDGGGLAAMGTASSLVVLNSTLSGNAATGSGGGVYSQDTPVVMENSTVTLNAASSGGGIGLLSNDNGESLVLVNTIVAANTATIGADFLAPFDFVNDLTVLYSLVGDNNGTSLAESSFSGADPLADANGNLVGGGAGPLVDPGLATLADNGGATQTHALLVNSFAVDAGDRTQLPQDVYDVDSDNNVIEFLPTDQRSGPAVRVVNDLLDIGAFELPPAVVIGWATPAPIVYGTALTNTQLNATANDGGQPNPGPVFGSYVYSPIAGTVLQAGENQVLSTTFTPNELRQFRRTDATVEIDVAKADPILNWSNPADIVYLTPLSAIQLDAVEQNALPGSFVYAPAAGTILNAGDDQVLNVTFTPAESLNYNIASTGVSINVVKATPAISWADPADISYGTLLSETQLNATADGDLPGSFEYTPAAGALLDVGEDQPLNVVFTPTESENYNSVPDSVVIDVVKADPVLTWPDPSDIVYGTPLSGSQLNATVGGGVGGNFVYTPAAGIELESGENQLLSVVFNPTETTRYNQASATAEINVLKADPVITWNDPVAIPHGTLLSGTQLNAAADVAGNFVYNPQVGVQLGVGNGQSLNVTFTPDDDNFNSAVDSATIDVLPNQAPGFSASDPPTIQEDAGAQTVAGFISGFDAGAGESALQSVLTYAVSSIGHPGMFTTLPAVSNAGVLTYEIAADVFGESTFELAVQDDGGTDSGGVDTSTTQTFTITITGVNDAPGFDIGGPVEVLEDSGVQTVVGFATDFVPGQYEDGTWPGSQLMHDEGPNGAVDPLSTDNNNPTPLGSTQPGSNLVSGHVANAFVSGDMDVFTFTVESGFQWSGMYVDSYAYPNGPTGDNAAFLAINTGTSFPYNANDFANNPNVDYNSFLGGTIFGTSDVGGSNILPRAGNVTGSGFSGPLGAGTYTIYIQQTGPASTYTLDFEVTSVARQVVSSYEVSSVSVPSLFASGPSIDANGELTFTPAADTFGTSTFQVRVLDDGGTANGGVDASGFLTGTITITGVNDAPGFDIGGPVEVLEDSGVQTVVGFATDFVPGQYEDGTWPGSQLMHDEGPNGAVDPLSTDNNNPTPLGSTQPGSNLVSGHVANAFVSGDMDVFTFTVESGFQWSGMYVDSYAYPNGPTGDNAAFLAINTGTSFPYNANDFANNPNVDYNSFLGGTIFGTSDVGGSNILPRAGNVTGSGFSGPLGAGTYTIYIQQTGPASTYTLDFEVTSVARQVVSSYEVSSVSVPSLFASGPSIDANGELTFTPAADTFGTSTFQVRVLDDGGTANGGVDASGFLTGTITVDEVVLDRDYGDAPAAYAVLAVDNGASHVVGSLTLGVAVDAESDGQPSVNADGDGADDDGVVELASVLAVSDAATSSSFLIAASEAGRVDAWIDFDENGVWTDAGEQIANDVVVSSGDNTFSYVVPAGTAAGEKVARFRLSSAGGLAPTGEAADGEVEDRLLSIGNGTVPSAVTVQMNSAATTLGIDLGVLTISDGISDLFAAPLASVDSLTVNGRSANDEVTLLFETGPVNGMNLDGDGGANSLVVSGVTVDLTSSGSLVAVNFQSIDASSSAASEIILDGPTISALSPANKTVRVTGGDGDVVVLTDAENWRMESPVIDNGQFYRVAVNQVTSEQIQLDDASSAWQNLVETTDVDASGITTVFDALLIITEAGNNLYSDSTTLVLSDPVSVGVWPGTYFDVNRDGKATPLDALQILNRLAVIGGGEGEAVSPSGDVSRMLGNASTLPWLAQNSRGSVVRSEEQVAPVHGFGLPHLFQLTHDFQLADAIVASSEVLPAWDFTNTTSGMLSLESQLWADSVDQLLSDEVGFSEKI